MYYAFAGFGRHDLSYANILVQATPLSTGRMRSNSSCMLSYVIIRPQMLKSFKQKNTTSKVALNLR